ncbi:ROK family protein, partial [bacterium]
MNEERFRVGMDLGGTKMETIVLDPENEELYRHREPTPKLKESEYKDFMGSVHRLLLDSFSHVPQGKPFTVGIGFPGSTMPATQKVIKSSITCLKDKPLKRDIEALLGRSVAMDNDANCFALAESLGGAAKNYRFVFGVILGTGCGGGICIDDKIHIGRNGVAAEWGHFVV